MICDNTHKDDFNELERMGSRVCHIGNSYRCNPVVRRSDASSAASVVGQGKAGNGVRPLLLSFARNQNAALLEHRVLEASSANCSAFRHANSVVLELVVLLIDRVVVAEDACILLTIALDEVSFNCLLKILQALELQGPTAWMLLRYHVQSLAYDVSF